MKASLICWKSTHLSIVWLFRVTENEMKTGIRIKMEEYEDVELTSHHEYIKNTPTCGTILTEN